MFTDVSVCKCRDRTCKIVVAVVVFIEETKNCSFQFAHFSAKIYTWVSSVMHHRFYYTYAVCDAYAVTKTMPLRTTNVWHMSVVRVSFRSSCVGRCTVRESCERECCYRNRTEHNNTLGTHLTDWDTSIESSWSFIRITTNYTLNDCVYSETWIYRIHIYYVKCVLVYS